MRLFVRHFLQVSWRSNAKIDGVKSLNLNNFKAFYIKTIFENILQSSFGKGTKPRPRRDILQTRFYIFSFKTSVEAKYRSHIKSIIPKLEQFDVVGREGPVPD